MLLLSFIIAKSFLKTPGKKREKKMIAGIFNNEDKTRCNRKILSREGEKEDSSLPSRWREGGESMKIRDKKKKYENEG